MKRLMIVIIITALLLPLTAIAVEQVDAIQVNNGIEVSVERVSARTFRIDCRTDERILSTFSENEELPAITRWVALSPSGNISIHNLNVKTSPLSSDIQSSSFVLQCSPLSLSIGSEWAMQDIRFVPVTFHPVVFQSDDDPYLIKHISAEITIDGALPDLSKLSPTLRQMWGNLLLNRDDPRRDQDSNNCASVCVYVLPDDQRVSEVMQPIYDLRRREGFRVDTLVHDGSAARIKDRIQIIHDMGKLPVEYVCLVGDFGGEFSVPTFIRGTSDYPYGLLEGSDP
ncbi:MAG: hypothetical protein HQ568_12095, partial [Calditrichaeota bacterium]|nr:hypothetical protein [Calditrichota bacterium]